MGPGDPFASPSPPPASAPPPATPSATRAGATDHGATDGGGPVRIQARMPDPAPQPRGPLSGAARIGAVAGLVLGGLIVTVGVGPTLVVALCTAIGAALGALLKNAFADGVDLGAAWRALRRR